MTDMYAHVSVRILEKEYQVSCPASERTDLLDSAEMLNEKMREIRDSGTILGSERIAVITALNMANELLRTSNLDKEIGAELPPRLKDLESKISRVFEEAKQLEI